MGKLYSSSFFARAYCLSLWYLVLFVQMVSLWYYYWTLAEKLGGLRQNKWDCKLLWIWTCLEVSRNPDGCSKILISSELSKVSEGWAHCETVAGMGLEKNLYHSLNQCTGPADVLLDHTEATFSDLQGLMVLRFRTFSQYCNGCRSKTGHPAITRKGD